MKIKAKLLSIFFLFLTLAVSNANVTFDGISLSNADGILSGDLGVYIVSKDNTSFDFGTLTEGLNVTDSATYGDSFTVIGNNLATSGFGSVTIGSGHSFSLTNGVDTGDQFAIVVFEDSTTTLLADDNFRVWTDSSWLVPNDGLTVSFDSELFQLSDAADFSGTVVPEPSTYALFAGILSIGYIIVRRSRARA